jgi:cell division protein FtsQ
VRQVIVEGRQKTPEPLLRAAFGVEPGDPLLSVSLRATRQRIETIQWVRQAEVERRLPDTIVVRLVERRPFAVWQHDGRFVLIDRDGKMVTDSDVATFATQVPLAVRVGERRWNLRMKNGADILLPEDGEVAALARLAMLQTTHAVLDRPVSIDLRQPDRVVFRPLPGAAVPSAETRDPQARRPT